MQAVLLRPVSTVCVPRSSWPLGPHPGYQLQVYRSHLVLNLIPGPPPKPPPLPPPRDLARKTCLPIKDIRKGLFTFQRTLFFPEKNTLNFPEAPTATSPSTFTV